MAVSEDVLDVSYKYSWSNSSELSLEDFLNKYKPSMVQNDGTKPWVWVHGRDVPSIDDVKKDAAIEEGAQYLKEVTERVEEIKNDPAIPVRSNKKTGAKSKKELREQTQAEAVEKLKEISTKHGYVSGKWLIFAPSDKVDIIWKSVATSLLSGPLAETSAYRAKVATSPEQENPNYQHVICIYMPDVYDKDAVTKVMKVLLRNHGVNLTGVKSNLYTSMGIDSKHASGIQSTVWKNSTLMKDSEIKELKDAYFAEISTAKPKAPKEAKAVDKKQTTTIEDKKPSVKAKPKLKKKANDDPFVSDNDEEEEQRDEDVKAKKASLRAKRRKSVSDHEDDEELDERRKKPRGKK